MHRVAQNITHILCAVERKGRKSIFSWLYFSFLLVHFVMPRHNDKNIMKRSVLEKATCCPFWNGTIRSVKEMVSFTIWFLFRTAMKLIFLVMKYRISLPKWVVLLQISSKSFCKRKLSVYKMDRFTSGRATSCLS